MSHTILRTNDELAEFCDWLADASTIAFDTEFVSEDCYRPQLCLLQVAADAAGHERLVAIDPLAIADVDAFWRVVADGEHQTIVHAGRQELVYCLEATGKPPANLFDVQIASGLVGREYPASYSSLTNKLLGTSPKSGETRTNWRRRPLSDRQIDYALDDVRFLPPMRDVLQGRLAELGREQWMAEEMASWQDGVANSLDQQQWRRVSGTNKLGPRELAIVRELWRWREQEAERRNRLPRRVLRDDLLVELARRRTSDEKRIHTVRGFERRDLRKIVPELAERIEAALQLPEDECPQRFRREDAGSKRIVLGQFLASTLSALCRQTEISPGLLGGPGDVRELIAHRLGERPGKPPPALAVGWRAEIVGHTLEELLAGKLAVRVRDADEEQPLVFE